MDVVQRNAEELYGQLVTQYIREKYLKADDETALINNYLADPETYGEDYREYQAYRVACKERARARLGLLQGEE